MLVWHTIYLCLWHQGVMTFLLVWISFRKIQITRKPERGESVYGIPVEVELCILSALFSRTWKCSGPCEGQLPSKAWKQWDTLGHGECPIHSCSHRNGLMKSCEVCQFYCLHWADTQKASKGIAWPCIPKHCQLLFLQKYVEPPGSIWYSLDTLTTVHQWCKYYPTNNMKWVGNALKSPN